MHIRFLQIIVLILTSFIYGFGQTNAWNGLLPLRSTRADVERLLGEPLKNSYGIFKYDSKDGKADFFYSNGKCDGGWDVPIGTVLRIETYPVSLEGKSLKDLEVDKSKFSVTNNDVLSEIWTNPEEGVP